MENSVRSSACQIEHLKILVEDFEPYSGITEENGTVLLKGYMTVVLNHIVALCNNSGDNFTYTLMVSPDRTFGVYEDGNWTGMIGMLQRKEADMILTPMTLSKDRLNAVLMSVPLDFTTTNMLVGVPKSPELSFEFLMAADKMVLLGMVISIFVLYLCGKIVTAVLKCHYQSVEFWTLIEAFFQKGVSRMPKSNTGRILLCSWVLTTFVLINAISSFLTSMLSIGSQPDYIRSLEDIERFPRISPILPEGSSTTSFVENSTHHALRDIWWRIKLGNGRILHPQNFSDMLDDVEEQKAFLMKNAEELKHLLRERSRRLFQNCRFDISEPIRSMSLALAFRRGLPLVFTEKINYILSWSVDMNFLKWTDPGTDIEYHRCLVTEENGETRSLTLGIFKGPLMIWAVGCSLAISVFLIECKEYCSKERQPKETQAKERRYRKGSESSLETCQHQCREDNVEPGIGENKSTYKEELKLRREVEEKIL